MNTLQSSHTSGVELPLRAKGPVATYKPTTVGHVIQQLSPLPVLKQHDHTYNHERKIAVHIPLL
jgi:hypothetical protein